MKRESIRIAELEAEVEQLKAKQAVNLAALKASQEFEVRLREEIREGERIAGELRKTYTRLGDLLASIAESPTAEVMRTLVLELAVELRQIGKAA